MFIYKSQTDNYNKQTKPQPDKRNIFIHHRLTVVLCALEKGSTRKFAHVLHCPIKKALLLTAHVLESRDSEGEGGEEVGMEGMM